MKEFESYYEDLGFEIGSGFAGNSDWNRMKDERNKRVFMEKQNKILDMQQKEIQEQQAYRELHRNEILAQQQYRKEQIKDAILSKRLLVFNTIITTAALIVAIIALFK